MIHVVNWSGGPDSTYALMKVLQRYPDENKHSVIAYYVRTEHIDESLKEEYYELEEQAVDTIAPLLRERYRDFHLKKTTVHTPFIRNLQEVSFFAIEDLWQEGGKIYSGRCIEDTHGSDDLPHREDNHRDWDKNLSADRLERQRRRIFSRLGITIEYIGLNVPKTDIRIALGDLWPLTLSCYFIQDGQPCGKCYKCDERRDAEAGIRWYKGESFTEQEWIARGFRVNV